MFGPNNKPDYHHRGDQFKELYSDLEESFLGVAGLDSTEWRVFFITGSGTLANEIMMHSVVNKIRVTTIGHFSDRFRAYLNQHNKQQRDFVTGEPYNAIGCVYETSESNYNKNIKPANDSSITLVLADCVSSFPYYDIPDDVDMWTTVSGKQLQCSPGISMVVVKKDVFYSGLIKPIEDSYLSLARYATFADQFQTPNTPAINLFKELLESLKNFNTRHISLTIDERRKKILELLPLNSVMGEGPVLTLKNNNSKIDNLVIRFDLYNNSSNGPQIFLWSGDDLDYESLYAELKRVFK